MTAIPIPEGYKDLNLQSTGTENIDKREIHQKGFAQFPTWQIIQPNLILDQPGAAPGKFFRTVEDETGEKTYNFADQIECTLISTVFPRLKKTADKTIECFSEDGKVPIVKYRGRYSQTCPTCAYYRMKTEDLKGEAPCKQKFKFALVHEGFPDVVEILLLGSGNYPEVNDLLAHLDTGTLVPGLSNIKSLFAFKFRITTHLITNKYRYYNAQFEVIGLNEIANVQLLDSMVTGNKNLLISSGGSTAPALPETVDPDEAPAPKARTPQYPGQPEDEIPF
jgi:hypothetical protein